MMSDKISQATHRLFLGWSESKLDIAEITAANWYWFIIPLVSRLRSRCLASCIASQHLQKEYPASPILPTGLHVHYRHRRYQSQSTSYVFSTSQAGSYWGWSTGCSCHFYLRILIVLIGSGNLKYTSSPRSAGQYEWNCAKHKEIQLGGLSQAHLRWAHLGSNETTSCWGGWSTGHDSASLQSFSFLDVRWAGILKSYSASWTPLAQDWCRNWSTTAYAACSPYHRRLCSSHLAHRWIAGKGARDPGAKNEISDGIRGYVHFECPTEPACRNRAELVVSGGYSTRQRGSWGALEQQDIGSCHNHRSLIRSSSLTLDDSESTPSSWCTSCSALEWFARCRTPRGTPSLGGPLTPHVRDEARALATPRPPSS